MESKTLESADDLERRIQERIKSVRATSTARYERIVTAGLNIGAVNQQAMVIAQSNKTVTARFNKIIKLLDETMAIAGPHLVCRAGCSGCCQMPVVISTTEAKRISEATGRSIAAVGAQHKKADLAKYVGRRCTFLGANGLCEIYESRPVACRGYATLDDDELLCNAQPYGRPDVQVSHLDLRGVDMALVTFLHHEVFADIRDFFPAP